MTREEWLIQKSIESAAADTGLPADTIKQVAQHESSLNPSAQSPTGPQGIMQLSKAAAIDGGIDPAQRFDIQQNIKGGANYLKQQADRFGLDRAYAAYHDGPGAIAAGQPVSEEGQWTPGPESRESFLRRVYQSGQARPSVADTYAKHLETLQEKVPNHFKQSQTPALSAEERANIADYERHDAVRKMPDIVPHDVLYAAGSAVPAYGFALGPALGVGLRSLENSDTGRAIVDKTKDIPYLGAAAKFMLGQGDSKFDIKAGQEASKFIAGAQDAGDFVKYLLPGDDSKVFASVNARAAEQHDLDKAMEELNANSGVGGTAGSMLPYVLSQYLLGAPFAKAGEAAVAKLLETPREAAAATKGFVANSIEKAAEGPGVIGDFGKAHEIAFTDPWAKAAAIKAKQVNLPNPYRQGAAGRIIGGTLLGGAEGGLHYDNTVGTGLFNGAIGSLGGEFMRPHVIRSPNYNSEPEQDLVDWWKGEGAQPWPGLETGSKSAQDFESGMRNTRYLKNTMQRKDSANDIINNRIVAKAIGIEGGENISDFGPEVLRNHLADLGKKYDALEAGTVARVLPSDHVTLATHASKLINDFDPEVQAAGKTVKSYAERIKEMVPNNYPVRDPLTGRLQPQTMDGSTYKGLRSDIKADITSSFQNGNTKRANALKPVLNMLDDAVERGLVLSSAGKVTTAGEPVGVAEWRKLNEQMALTHLVKDHGLTPTGTAVDPRALLSHFRSSDVDRFYTGTGIDAIQQLHKVAKMGYMSREASGALEGLGTHPVLNSGKQTFVQKLLQTPQAGMLNMLPEVAMKLYEWGWPSRTGYLNMSGKGFGDPGMYTRAFHQGAQPWPKLYDKAVEAKDYVGNELEGVKRGVEKSYKEFTK